MLDILKHLLDYLSGIVDPARQAAIERRHRQALDGERVDRLPLVVACPLPEDARFKPLPYREAFTYPERMLYNELVHAFDTSIALRDRLVDDLQGPLDNLGSEAVNYCWNGPPRRARSTRRSRQWPPRRSRSPAGWRRL